MELGNKNKVNSSKDIVFFIYSHWLDETDVMNYLHKLSLSVN